MKIFWLLEMIRPTMEREYIKYIYILLRICIHSLLSRENWDTGTMESLYRINSVFIYIFMLPSKISNAFIPYYVYFSSL